MKNLILSASAMVLLAACNQSELDKTNREKDSLQFVINERELSINEFIASFNDVEHNLNAVAAKQQIIALNSNGELKSDQKTRINAEIQAINTLMDANRKKINNLNNKLKNAGTKNEQLEKTIVILTNQLTLKYRELDVLNGRLNMLNGDIEILQTRIDTLLAQNDANTKKIAETISDVHTAYYIIGKTKYLRDEKLIDSKGGLLGIGATPTLSKSFDNTKFTRIDYTQISGFPINSNDIKIITSHPADSYTLDKDAVKKKMIKTLIITNPEKFWSLSKYLVIAND